MGVVEIAKLVLRNVFKTGTEGAAPESQDAILETRKDVLWDVLREASMGYWEWNMDQDLVKCSEGTYDLLGIKSGDYAGKLKEAIIGLVHPDYLEYAKRQYANVMETKTFPPIKMKIRRPDGKESWIIVRGKMRIEDRENVVCGIIMDVTEAQDNELRLHAHLDFFQAMLDGIPFPIFYKDEACIYRQCNDAFSNYLQTPKENITGHTVFDVSPSTLAHVYQDKDVELIANGGIQHYQSRVMRHTGEYRDVEFYKSVIEHGHQHQRGIVGIIHDISKWKQAEDDLKKLIKLKDSMMEMSQIVLGLNDIQNLFEIVMDKAMETIDAADVGCVLLKGSDDYLRVLSSRGYEEEGIPDFKLKIEETYAWSKVKGAFDEAFTINDVEVLSGGDFPDTLETNRHQRIKSSLSTPILLDGQLVALVNVDSYENHRFTEHDLELMNYMKAQVELTLSNLKLYQQTVSLSQFDTLTGAYNRSYFDEMIERFITKADRYNESFCLVLFDLDQLKRINESYGHRAGDVLLKSFVANLKRHLNDSDFLARYGGDEFVAVFFEQTETEIKDKLDALNKTFAECCFEFNDQCFGCSFSYGVTQFPFDGRDYPSLFSTLDKRLGKSKMAKRKEQG